MKILFGVRAAGEDWEEELITEVEERIPEASKWAVENGFNRLREAEIDGARSSGFGDCLRETEEG